MQKKDNANIRRTLATIIMAAGKGTRMNDPSKAKVMYEVLGKPMVHYVIDLAKKLEINRNIVVVGYQRDAVIRYLQDSHPDVEIAVQAEQLGTGHAVMQTETLFQNFEGDIVVLSGDVPLLTTDTMNRFIDFHFQSGSEATILTADIDNPTGYGRIIRQEDGSVKKIVEHKDATDEEREIQEINSGIYVFHRKMLFETLHCITPHNVQNEYYLTDVFDQFRRRNRKVTALKAAHVEEILGVNTIDQLAEVDQLMANRINRS